MTTRLAAFTVILERDIREDDAEMIIAAIRQLRGVSDVQVIEASPELHIAERRAKAELTKKLWDVLEAPLL